MADMEYEDMKEGVIMQETLQQYRERTGFMWDSLAHHGGLRTSGGLTLKVDPDGHFRPFYGDTVIFALPQPMLGWLEQIQTELYTACGEYLAEPLPPETFHITLHDLLNQAEHMPEGVLRNQQEAAQTINDARRQYSSPIAVRSCCVFSMVNTSIVMGFEPATESDCAILMSLYERFQQLVPLSYPLTLHVTLAYYRPGEYNDDVLLRLRSVLQHLGRDRHEWQLDMQGLHYVTFESMADYRFIPASKQ